MITNPAAGELGPAPRGTKTTTTAIARNPDEPQRKR